MTWDPTPSSISTLALGFASVFYFHKFSVSSNWNSVWKLPKINVFIVTHIHIRTQHTYGEKEVSAPTFKFVCLCVFMHKTIKSYWSPILNQHYKVHSRLSYFSICSFSLTVKKKITSPFAYFIYLHAQSWNQFRSVTQLCLILCSLMDCSMPGLPEIINSQSLLRFMSIELMMPSNHLIIGHALILLYSIFTSIRVFSNESILLIR